MPDLTKGIKITEGTAYKRPYKAYAIGKFVAFDSKEPMNREIEKLRKIYLDTWIAPRAYKSLRGAISF